MRKQENRAGPRVPLYSRHRRIQRVYINTDPHVTTNESHPFNCTLHVPVVVVVVVGNYYWVCCVVLISFSFLFFSMRFL